MSTPGTESCDHGCGSSSPGSNAAPRWTRRDVGFAGVLFAVIAGAALFFELGTYRTLGSHEAYAAVPAREMLATGDWIVPRFGGLPRLEKPPLPYWAVAASGAVFGEVNEWTARLPAAIAALGLALLIGCWAVRWYGPAAGYAAALVQVTSIYAITFGRKAEIDMLLWLCMTGALFLVAHQPHSEPRHRAFVRWIGIYALLSLAWLAKFHYGPVLVLAPVVAYSVIQKRYALLWQLANPVGLLVFAAAVVVWPWLVLQQVPWAWEVWRHETLGRAVGELGHRPAWYYLPHIAWLTLPWLPLALARVPASCKEAWREADARERFLWVWFVTQFVIVSASADKHKHYIVPALPVLSLLAGRALAGIVAAYRGGEWRLTRMAAVLLGGGGLALAVGGGAAVSARWPQQTTPAWLAAGGFLAVGWTALALFRRERPRAAALAVTVQYVVSFAVLIGCISPAADRRRPMVEFARSLAGPVSDEPVYVYRLGQDPAVFYLGRRAWRIESRERLHSELARHGRLRVLTSEPLLSELGEAEQQRLIAALPGVADSDDPRDAPRYVVELTVPPTIVPAGRVIEPETEAESWIIPAGGFP